MTEKNVQTTASPKKKVYRKPAPVKSVDSGKILSGICPYSCGQQVADMNSNCGH